MKGPLLPGMGEFFPPKPTLEFSHDQIAFVHPSPLDYGRISHAWRLVPEAPCQDQRHWHVSFGSITTNDIDIYIATVLRWSSPHGLPRRHHTTPRPVLGGAYICTKRQHLRQGCELHLAVQAPDGIHTATLCLTFFCLQRLRARPLPRQPRFRRLQSYMRPHLRPLRLPPRLRLPHSCCPLERACLGRTASATTVVGDSYLAGTPASSFSCRSRCTLCPVSPWHLRLRQGLASSVQVRPCAGVHCVLVAGVR
jgi:hypothetical protein